MKCSGCGADIFEEISKCPFCKTPTTTVTDDKFKNFDFTYTITSKEQIKAIRDTVAEVSEEKKSPLRKLSISKKPRMKSSESGRKFRFSNLKSIKFNFNFNKKNPKALAFLGVAAICLIAVIWGITVLIGSAFGNNDTVYSYTYIKDNSMYLIYNSKSVEISHTTISEDYLRRSDADAALTSGAEIARDTSLAHNSKNGMYTYFFENYDPETDSGVLKSIKKGNEKSIKAITDEVHNSVVISKEGNAVLFLQTADKNGDMGVLYYWKSGMSEPHKISSDIDHGTFAFSADGDEALFLQNLDRTVMKGDLYSQNLKNLKKEKVKVDSDVCRIFGTDLKGDRYIYAKNYDTTDESFEIYTCVNKPDSEKIRLGERTKLAPQMLKTKDNMYVYGLNDDGTHNLYYVNIKNGDKEKIASGVYQILKISKDEKYVMYDKVYKGATADYYIHTSGKQPQKVAENVNVNFSDVGRSPQLAASDDLKTIVYINGFDSRTGSGKLFITKFKPGKESQPEQISDDVHSCHMTVNGSIVYTKDYSQSRKVFDIYTYKKGESEMLKDEISPEMFEVSKTGDTIFYIADLNNETKIGSLFRSNLAGKSETLSEGVFALDQTKSGDIFFFKNLNTENGKFDIYYLKNGAKKAVHLDSKIVGIMPY